MINIMYEGADITEYVQVRSCIVRDTAGSRCDSLALELENAAGYERWGLSEDDQIIVERDGYDSGIMYVNTVQADEGRYRIYATSLPCKARQKGYDSFSSKTIGEIIEYCSAYSGMEYAVYGLDPDTVIPYIERNNEGYAAFLARFLALEGAVLKCVNGKYTAIGIEYAQDIPVMNTLRISTVQKGMQYSRNGITYRGLTVKNAYVDVTAEDTNIPDDHVWLTKNLPALNAVQASRWARGMLLKLNRESEFVYLKSNFNPGLTSMIRIDIEGMMESAGEWLIEEVEHDLKNLKTITTLRRCIRTIR